MDSSSRLVSRTARISAADQIAAYLRLSTASDARHDGSAESFLRPLRLVTHSNSRENGRFALVYGPTDLPSGPALDVCPAVLSIFHIDETRCYSFFSAVTVPIINCKHASTA